jgi:hypothetical protein
MEFGMSCRISPAVWPPDRGEAALASYKAPRTMLFVTEEELHLTGTAQIKPVEARALAACKLAECRGAGVMSNPIGSSPCVQ